MVIPSTAMMNAPTTTRAKKQQKKPKISPFKKRLFFIDNIAYEVYGLYGSEPFSAKVFIDRGFVWDIHSGEITI